MNGIMMKCDFLYDCIAIMELSLRHLKDLNN